MNSTNNRAAEALRNLPPTTLGVITLCVSIHLVQSILGWDLQLFTMCPRLILFSHEYYRVFTSVFFHANLMHIGMNMLSTAAIASLLEKKQGTLRLFFSIWWAILLTSAIYILIAYAASAVFRYDAWMYQHAVGFSGIIFYLSVLESRLHSGTRSIFGYFSVPSYAYPWVLLIFLQLVMPNLSFLGHLAGILNGTLEYCGALDVLYVGDSFLVYLESLPLMRKLVALDSFAGTTQGSGQRLRAESSLLASFSRKARHVLSKFMECIIKTIEKLLTFACGRTRRVADVSFRFWKRSTGNDIECGVIKPPEFYDGAFDENDKMYDDGDEREPMVSQIV